MLNDADYRTFVPGDVILHCPTAAPTVGFLSRGIVAVTYLDKHHPDAYSTHLVYDGEWLGVETLDCKCPPSASITWRAEDICVVGFLSAAGLSDPETLRQVLRSASQQQNRVLQQSMMSALPGDKRISMLIREIAENRGKKESGGIFIPALSRTKLAQRAGLGKEYVSRMITKLKDEGHIELRGNGVLLKTLGAQQ
jgi:CRP-like cAMP-binding protein